MISNTEIRLVSTLGAVRAVGQLLVSLARLLLPESQSSSSRPMCRSCHTAYRGMVRISWGPRDANRICANFLGTQRRQFSGSKRPRTRRTSRCLPHHGSSIKKGPNTAGLLWMLSIYRTTRARTSRSEPPGPKEEVCKASHGRQGCRHNAGPAVKRAETGPMPEETNTIPADEATRCGSVRHESRTCRKQELAHRRNSAGRLGASLGIN